MVLDPESQPPLDAFNAFVEAYKPLLPIPILAAVLVLVWLFFRGVWRELDEDAIRYRAEIHAQGRMDLRPLVGLAMVAIILTVQEYYGNRIYFDASVVPLLKSFDERHRWLRYYRYDELYTFLWWAGSRIGGYIVPFVVWRIAFPKDSLRDLGFRTKGFFDHAWIYGMFLAIVVPAMLVVAHNPDFGAYYPFYRNSSRSWFDFLAWEAMYFAQFFALEMFFRGFFLGALRRSFGSGAIFAMCVPYCMIHYGKPYLEACGAIIAGMALGSHSMKTKSIYQGFMVHVTVAILMDWLSLRHRKATPLHTWPTDLAFTTPREEQLREALAQLIERCAAALFAALFVFLIAMIIRARRQRLERMWVLPEP